MGRVIKLILYYIAYQLAFQGVFACGLVLLTHINFDNIGASPYFMPGIMACQALATLAVGIHLILGGYVSREKKNFSLCSSDKMVVAALFIISMGCWTNYLNELLNLPNNLEDAFNAMLNSPLGIFSIVILAPIVEELLFRGAIQGHLMKIWKNPKWAILASSVIFGLVHGNPVQIPFAIVTGLALGWVYYRTGNLLPGILMHFINNGSSVVLYYLLGKTDTTMCEQLGSGGAACLALAGAIASAICIWYLNDKSFKCQGIACSDTEH